MKRNILLLFAIVLMVVDAQAQDFKFTKKLIDEPGSNVDGGRRLGESVAISDTHIAIGSFGTTINTTSYPVTPNYISPAYVADVSNLGAVSSRQLVDRNRTDYSSRTDFGASIAVSEEYATVSEPKYFDPVTEGQNDATGAVSVYHKQGGSWIFKQRLRPADLLIRGHFGSSVQVAGDYIFVGCSPSNSPVSGSVYVFKKDNTGDFVQKQKITLAYSVANTTIYFGSKISVSGDYLVVASRIAAYIYKRSNDVFQLVDAINLPLLGGTNENVYFDDISVSGDYLVLGASGTSYTTGGTEYKSTAGAVYLFKRHPTTNLWEFEQRLAAQDRTAFAKFGSAVCIDGDRIAVGAPGQGTDVIGANNVGGSGAVYILEKNPSTNLWFQKQKIVPFDRQIDRSFGNAVALKGANLIVGSNGNQNLVNGVYSGNSSIGAAYLFSYKNDVALPEAYTTVALALGKQSKVELADDNNSPILALGTFGAVPLTDNLTTVKVWKESGVPIHSGILYLSRHYELTPFSNPNTSTATVTLYFNQQEFLDFNSNPAKTADFPVNATDVAGIANLRITKIGGTSSDGSGLMATYSGTTTIINPDDDQIIWNANAGRWEVTFNVTGFSGFFATTTPTVLPVNLLSYTAEAQQNSTVLAWRTASESNNKNFVIYRSGDDQQFIKIGEIIGSGTRLSPGNYSFIDKKPLIGNNYYKLVQVDLDGVATELGIRSLNYSLQSTTFNLYPNPTKDKVNIQFEAGKYTMLTVRNGEGKVIKTIALTLNDQEVFVDLAKFPKGLYFITLAGENGNSSKKVIKN